VRLAASDGEALAWIYRNGRVESREDENEGGVRLIARLDAQALGRFRAPVSRRLDHGDRRLIVPGLPRSRL
jgi:hypothetical protein